MAITPWNDATDLLHIALRAIGEDFLDLQVCELGNQRVKGWGGMVDSHTVFGVCGAARHVAIDINGRDGALPFDLGKPLTDEQRDFLGQFDLVTNFGTSEHVDSAPDAQLQCFKTIHMACRVGGAMVHYVPQVGSCRRHGFFKYQPGLFQVIAEANHYGVVLCEDRWKWALRRRRRVNQHDRYVCAVLVKGTDQPFNEDHFPTIPRG